MCRRSLPLIALVVLVAACSSDLPTAPAEEAGRSLVQEVTGLEIGLSDSCPPAALATVHVGITPCDELLPAQVIRDGQTLTIRLEVEREAQTCILPIVGKTVEVGLGSDLAPGEYRVLVPSLSTRVGDETFQVTDC